MKAPSLLLLRTGTGLLLILWGLVRLFSPSSGAGVSTKYYRGLGADETIQLVWGGALVVVGVLTVLGLLRRFAYPAQAVILITGALSIWKYLLDPLGLWLLDRESSQILFFPSLTLAAATLVLIAFRDEDSLSLDSLRERR
jgi:putative oxidoreductase